MVKAEEKESWTLGIRYKNKVQKFMQT